MADSQQADTSDALTEAAYARVLTWQQTVRTALAAAAAEAGDADGDVSTAPHDAGAPLGDAESIPFANQLLQYVAGTDDPLTAAFGLRQLAKNPPQQMPRRERLALQAGALTALGLPWAVMPLVRRWIRGRLQHLMCVTPLPGESNKPPATLTETLTELTDQHTPGRVRLTGFTPLGPVSAGRELRRLRALIELPEVTELLVDLGRLAPGDAWATDARTLKAVGAAREILAFAHQNGTYVTLNTGSYADAGMLPEVLTQLLADPDLAQVPFGVTLRAEVPESAELLTKLSVWAATRASQGGAEISVRIDTGSTASAESVHAILSGLAVAVFENRELIEAAALRLLRQLRHASGLRAELASDSPFLVAAALDLLDKEPLTIEVRSGLAAELLLALRADDVTVRVHLPVVAPGEFGGNMTEMLVLTAEAADASSALNRQRMLSAVPATVPAAAEETESEPADAEETDSAPAADGEDPLADPRLAAELTHFAAVCATAQDAHPLPHRAQDRTLEWDPSARDSSLFFRPATYDTMRETGGLTAAVLGLSRNPETGEIELDEIGGSRTLPVISDSGFSNEPDTDVSRAVNRAWLRTQNAEAETHELAHPGTARDTVAATAATAPKTTDTSQRTATTQQGLFVPRPRAFSNTLSLRARVLRRIALHVAAERDAFTQIIAAISPLPLVAIDAEVNRLIDSARYLAQQAESLQRVRGAIFKPAGSTVLMCDDPRYFVELLGGLLSSVAAGNTNTLLLADPLAGAAQSVLDKWQESGLAVESAAVHTASTGAEIGAAVRELQPQLGLLFGSTELREQVQRLVPELPLQARTSQVGSVIITGAADYDTAVQDIVASAFGGPDNGLRTIRAVVATAAVARSERFQELLGDAVRGVAVAGHTQKDALQPAIQPLKNTPSAPQLKALTELERGETWLVTPRQLDATGLAWSPGVKLGVRPDSTFWEVAAELPVLGIATANTFNDATKLANELGDGAVQGLFSWDADEILGWVDHAEAASLTVNRATVGAKVERLPSGSWNHAGTGATPLTGGPHQLMSLGAWQLREGTPSSTLHLRGLDPEVTRLIELAQNWLDYPAFDKLRRAALADALTWRTQLGVVRDIASLGIEHNVLRYWPVPTHVRLAEGEMLEPLIRVLCAALLVQAPLTVSTAEILPPELEDLLDSLGVDVLLQSESEWYAQLETATPDAGGGPAERIRMIGGDRAQLTEWLATRPNIGVWTDEVTLAGPVELLSFLREQSLSISAHRHGLQWELPELRDWLLMLGR